MGKSIVIIGAQWGDEGKGKIVDLLTERADAVIRFQGGHNAGHTLVADGETTALSLIPSGILHKHAHCFIGNGVVLYIEKLLQEIDMIQARGIEVTARLKISESCPLLMPYHIALDKAREAAKGKGAIGTTIRGIGPAYEDKIARRGLRVADLSYPEQFISRLRELLDYHNFVLKNYFHVDTFDANQLADQWLELGNKIKSMVTDVPEDLWQRYRKGENLLFEGAQGTFLDIDHGTYPYVTSSNTTAGAVVSGCGIGPHYLNYILGIAKAYTSRVGAGPFPTELNDSVGDHIRDRGREYGTVTKRPRRCGWFDAVSMRRSVLINSLSAIALTKLDVLDDMPTIKVAVAYRHPQGTFNATPLEPAVLAACEPVYEEIPGWCESTLGIDKFDKLPKKAQAYLARLEELLETPIDILSTGPDRKHTIMRRHGFDYNQQ